MTRRRVVTDPSLARFDPESGEPAVISERTWMVTYAGRTDLAALPTEFHFLTPEADAPVAESAYMRYEDADLKAVEPIVSLEQKYGEVQRTWPWVVAGLVPVLAAGGLGYRAWKRRHVDAGETGLQLPETLTPFNVLALLRRIDANNGFDPHSKEELATSIQSLERFYFAGSPETNGDGPPAPDLRALTTRWVARSR